MTPKTEQWLGLLTGVALIVIYSVIMMATEGAGGWAALLLVAGIGLIVVTAVRSSRRNRSN